MRVTIVLNGAWKVCRLFYPYAMLWLKQGIMFI